MSSEGPCRPAIPKTAVETDADVRSFGPEGPQDDMVVGDEMVTAW